MPCWGVKRAMEKILEHRGAVGSTASGRARTASLRKGREWLPGGGNSMYKGPEAGAVRGLLEEVAGSPGSRGALSPGLW